MTNIHSPANFRPEEYSVIDYLDNQRPRYMGGNPAWYAEEIKHWEREIARFFPNWRNGNPSIHRCGHCGNCNVRYIVAVEHMPTKTNVVFGSDCVTKLNFANRDELKAAQVRARAEQGNARMATYQKRCTFLEANPILAGVLTTIDNPVHAKNGFAHDVVSKLNQYGNLSERQVISLLASLARDIEWAATAAARAEAEVQRKATALPAPSGRVAVTGTVVMTKIYEGGFGEQLKMLVLLDTGAKVFCSVPSDLNTAETGELKGKRIEFTATFTPKSDDNLFAFGKRPTKARVLTTETPVVS